MLLNENKTKEMIICFKKTSPEIPNITINGHVIERVKSSKLLGINITSDLKWCFHVDYMYCKVNKRIYNLIVLKRAGLSARELFIIYVSMIRSVLEYGVQVWHSGLTEGDSNKLESIQKRCFKIICGNLQYMEAIKKLNTESLYDRRVSLSKQFFQNMQDDSHKLNYLLQKRDFIPGTCHSELYMRPQCKTDRYKNSFVPYCLFNFQK